MINLLKLKQDSHPCQMMDGEDEDDDIESLVTARSAGTEDMEPEEYEAYVKTQIAKAMGFNEDTTNKAELSLVDSYYEVQLAAVNKLAKELQESMTVHMKYEHGLMSEEEFKAYQLSGKK
jgi:5-formaminoimidazole-4-carboxamide-1-beta-D-ribofuranosyl 5'-monophosphate synthetase